MQGRKVILNKHPAGQNNDCTVRALATATGVDCVTVLGVLREAGRKDGAGFEIYKWIERNEGKVLGCLFTRVARSQDTGIYLLGHKTHVWTKINGQVYDAWDWVIKQKSVLVRYCYLVKRNHEPLAVSKRVAAITED